MANGTVANARPPAALVGLLQKDSTSAVMATALGFVLVVACLAVATVTLGFGLLPPAPAFFIAGVAGLPMVIGGVVWLIGIRSEIVQPDAPGELLRLFRENDVGAKVFDPELLGALCAATAEDAADLLQLRNKNSQNLAMFIVERGNDGARELVLDILEKLPLATRRKIMEQKDGFLRSFTMLVLMCGGEGPRRRILPLLKGLERKDCERILEQQEMICGFSVAMLAGDFLTEILGWIGRETRTRILKQQDWMPLGGDNPVMDVMSGQNNGQQKEILAMVQELNPEDRKEILKQRNGSGANVVHYALHYGCEDAVKIVRKLVDELSASDQREIIAVPSDAFLSDWPDGRKNYWMDWKAEVLEDLRAR
jgi:hypothetical protein